MCDVDIYLSNGRVIFVKDFDLDAFWNFIEGKSNNINFIRVNDMILNFENIEAVFPIMRD